jgi:hypothetical protein
MIFECRVVSHLLRANRDKYAEDRVVTFDEVKRTMKRSWHYANRALRLELTLPGGSDAVPAATHLNMAAILSSMGRHHAALQHAETALIRLNGQIRSIIRSNKVNKKATTPTNDNNSDKKKEESKGEDEKDSAGGGDEEKEESGEGDDDSGEKKKGAGDKKEAKVMSNH